MKNLKGIFLLVLAMFLVLTCSVISMAQEDVEVIKITAWTVGPDNPSIWRDKNLIEAANRLNAIYEEAGINKRIEIETDFWTQQKTKYWQRILLAFQSNDAPDIIVNGHEKIGQYASAGYLLSLDEYKEKYKNLLGDIYETLWDAGKFKGHYYGVPQDTEARMMYFRKDMLRKLGYSDSKIEELKKNVANGTFTLTDMAELAKKVKDAGLVDWGLYHRPTNGVDWFQWYISFGGVLQDQETGKLVFDKAIYKKFFQYYHDIVYKWEITPSSMTDYGWSSIHKGFLEGKAFLWQGGSWNYAEWLSDYGLTPTEGEKNIDFFLMPVGDKNGKPNTLSHPLMYMINKNSKHPEIAFQLVALASAPDLNLRHALKSGHLAIRKGEAEIQVYREDKFTANATKLLDYTMTMPNHSMWPKYQDVIYQTIKGVEGGQLSADKAVIFAATQLQRQLKDEVIIKD
ncbi:carbohydrate ABC transporter substrate-binding protein (CUT1 family) [Halanaerobium saccharolyticum]|uniref:Carbohydrate ABC transporter substrate-binding protein (CUT1 family) n=1 Tax=Halanaerobium saccharolyticum TaxID=43595 RepID=A0A2T5RF12_9FIRM|nr:extracellular solute-binding protein [Halanaerobium saccharolyticum]PTV92447.1 carbohydrate ABC transporter substrate-binding protein (CUT1 family) [Halanaerobium saccharolyticum]